MNLRINHLLRTNAALILLCIISIGVLVFLYRQSNAINSAELSKSDVPRTITMKDPSLKPNEAVENSDPRSPFRNMPATSTYQSFIYEPGVSVIASTTCTDAYRVVIVYPSTVDYRVDPTSFRYNEAQPCSAGKKYSEAIDFDAFNLSVGRSYYMIKASQGTAGIWNDPY